MTIREFALKHDVTAMLYKIPFRTDNDEDWDGAANHYAFVLTNRSNGNAKYKGHYTQGSAIKNRPTVDDILSSLMVDTMNIGESSFNLFCDEFGYDRDSRKAYGIYEACLKEAEGLKSLFTREQLAEFYQCEPL